MAPRASSYTRGRRINWHTAKLTRTSCQHKPLQRGYKRQPQFELLKLRVRNLIYFIYKYIKLKVTIILVTHKADLRDYGIKWIRGPIIYARGTWIRYLGIKLFTRGECYFYFYPFNITHALYTSPVEMWWHTVTHGRGSEGETGEWSG